MTWPTKEESLTVSCPACFAKPGEPCTKPTDTSRVPVAWAHLVRTGAYMESQEKDS